MGESSHVASRDDVANHHWGVAPELSFGLGGATEATLAYYHLSENDVPDSGIPFVGGAPARVPRHNYYGLASDRAISDVDIGTFRLRHTFSPNLWFRTPFATRTMPSTISSTRPTSERSNSGGQGAPAPGTPLGADPGRARLSVEFRGQTNLTDQFDVTARFHTGTFHHTLVAGLEAARQTNAIRRYNNPFNSDNDWMPETPLLDPDPDQVRPSEPVTATQDTTADSEAGYLTDTIGVGSHLDLIAGVRLDRFAARYVQRSLTTGAVLNLNHTDVVASPRLALVVKPAAWQSLYVSYGTSFDPSAEALTLTSKLANLGPVKATTYEIGSKTSLFDGGLLVTGALFHTQVDNAQINDPDNPGLTVLRGKQTVQGLELGVTGHLTPRNSRSRPATPISTARPAAMSAPILSFRTRTP